MSDLECNHCGGIAFTSRDYDAERGVYLFSDGDGEACNDCGFPGHVVCDDEDVCDKPACEECTEIRAAFGLPAPIRSTDREEKT